MEDQTLLRVISFNLKRDFGLGFRRSRKWDHRKALAAQFIRESGATIIGVQELLPSMRKDVQNLLNSEYRVLGFGRYKGRRPKNDEHSDIIIKNDDIKVNFIKTFWLSKKPEKISRAYFSQIFPRICTATEVKFERLGCTVRVFNTHLDHISSIARVFGIKVILEYISKLNAESPLPTILMGDLNCTPNSRPIQFLKKQIKEDPNIHLTDVYSTFDPETLFNTFHNFTGKIKLKSDPIDYIFVSDDFEIVESSIITDPIDGQYASDHYPLMATLRLKNRT